MWGISERYKQVFLIFKGIYAVKINKSGIYEENIFKNHLNFNNDSALLF